MLLQWRRAQYKQERVSVALFFPGRGAIGRDKDGAMHLKITLKFVVVDTTVDRISECVIRMQDAVSGVPECICQV